MQLRQASIEPSARILSDYVEALRSEVKRIEQEMTIARDEEFRRTLSVRLALKTQLIEDLCRCLEGRPAARMV